MNKAVGIGIVIVTIAAIIGVAYSVYSLDTSEVDLPASERKIIDEESEYTGTDYSVELTEEIGLKTP